MGGGGGGWEGLRIHGFRDKDYSAVFKPLQKCHFFQRKGLAQLNGLAPVVQRPDNFIRWIRHYSGSKIYFTLNVV